LPADKGFFLEQGHVVATLGGDARSLHPRWPGADHHHLALGPGGFVDDVRHAHVFTGGRGVLDAQHIQALVLTVDAIVGADALFDLVDLAHLDLGDQVRVGDVGAGHADHVHIAAFEDARGLVRVLDVLRMQHRGLDHFLDPGRQMQERLRWITHVRDDVGQGVVGIATRADHTDKIEHAGVVVILGDLLHVLVGQAVRMELIAAQADADAEIRADFSPHRLEHFQAETHAVFKAAAPFVGALVDPRAPELVDHVLMHRRQLHAIQATGFRPRCRAGVVTDHAPDLFRLDGLAGRTVYRLADARGRQQGRPMLAVPARAAAHVGNLDHDLGAMLVHGIGQVLEVRDDPVVGQVHRFPPALRAVDGHAGRPAADGQADPALGFLFVVLHIAVGGHAAVGGIHLGVGGTEHAVADGQFADLDRREHCFESHGRVPRLTTA